MSYFESRLVVDFENFKELKKRLNFYEELCVKNLILEPINKLINIPLDIKERVKKVTNINIFYRLNLQTDNINEFKKRIKKFNKFPDILSVESSNKKVQIRAARDSRVDIISFSDQKILKTLTPGIISLIKQNNSFLEFSLAQIMIKNKSLQSKNFRNLYRFIQLVMKLKANYLISGNFKKLYDFRHPRALISVCNSLLEIPLDEAKKIFKDNPRGLLKRVQKRQNGVIFKDNVKIIKG